MVGSELATACLRMRSVAAHRERGLDAAPACRVTADDDSDLEHPPANAAGATPNPEPNDDETTPPRQLKSRLMR